MESMMIEKFQQVDNKIDLDESNLTPIQDFYKDAKIFVTGGSGFLGNILIEKLLRSCPVSTIYVLIRSKKEKDIETRMNTVFDDPAFDRLKKIYPDFRRKIVSVGGDCELPELGLSAQDKKMLIEEVNMVFHSAATVRFDETLKKATVINVRATRDLVLMVQQMKQLKSFVHVSTAFSNCTSRIIEETVYPPSMNYQHLIDLVESLDSCALENLTSYLKGKYPNTYIYAKQIAEDLVKSETKELPSGIFRPSIVSSTYKEPIRGWTNNIYGATGAFCAAGVGLLRVMYADQDSNANVVPVDMCINGLIACAWDVAEKFANAQADNEQFVMPVYHYESSNDKPITWKNFKDMCNKYGQLTPTVRGIWIYYLFMLKSYTQFVVAAFFLHTVPAAIFDVILFCKGKKMRLIKAYRKIHTLLKVLEYFSVTSFTFKSANIRKMLVRMSKEDRDVFFCDLRELDWEEYFMTYGLGARTYLLKDPVETLPEAKRRLRKLQWANRILLTVLGILGFYILRLVMSVIYGFIFI